MSAEERPWGEAHQREADARFLELAAEQMRARRYEGERLEELERMYVREEPWRDALRAIGLPEKRIDREVQRVRDLAEGRRVRETVWRVRYKTPSGFTYTEDIDRETAWATMRRMRDESGWTGAVVKVTRIRRAP